MKKINYLVIVAEPWEIELGVAIINSLGKSEAQFIFFVSDHYTPLYHKRFIQEKFLGHRYVTIESIYRKWQNLHNFAHDDNMAYLKQWEEKYCKLRNMHELISTHQGISGWENSFFYYDITEEERCEIITDTIKLLEASITENNIEAIISLSRRTFISNVAYEYANSNLIPMLTLTQTRVGDRWIFRDDFGLGTSRKYMAEIESTTPNFKTYELIRNLKKHNTIYRSVTQTFVEEIEVALSEPCRYFLGKFPRIIRKSLSRLIYERKSREFRTNKLGENLLKLSIFEIRNLLNFMYIILKYKKIFSHETIILDSCAWFLHARPEDSSLVLGRGKDEIELISLVSRLMPANHVLYVKENAQMLGVRKFQFYKHIKELGNIKILPPTLQNEIIMQSCDRVIGLSGTALLEAKLLGKKVYSLGEPEFLGILDNEDYGSIENFLHGVSQQNKNLDNQIGARYIQWVINNSTEYQVPLLGDLTSEVAANWIIELSIKLKSFLNRIPSHPN